jgi:hypothetical protein
MGSFGSSTFLVRYGICGKKTKTMFCKTKQNKTHNVSEMTQTLYAHMNKRNFKNLRNKRS